MANEVFKLLDIVIKRIGQLDLWVMDRGYDGGEVLKYFLGKGADFMVRMKTSQGRNLIYRGKKVNISEVAHIIKQSGLF
ncbi:MAG: hypothetical protein PVH61_38725 [Candidatus Aminicenantes bacterium]|jgi:hypothetical protein